MQPHRRRRPSPGTVLGALALFVALGGTALAATGQLVNIADGSNAANVAKVDSTGALKTSVSATVAAPLPAKPFSLTGSAFDNDLSSSPVAPQTAATTATVALERIVVAPYTTATQARTGAVYQWFVNAGAACTAANEVDSKVLAYYRVGPNDTVVDALPSPLQLKPKNGLSWCLMALSIRQGAPEPQNNLLLFSYSGYTISGSAPVPPSGSAKPAVDLG